MPPYNMIHRCENGKYRIGDGKCKFDTKQKAINAFEQWIKNKDSDSYIELAQHIDEKIFVYDIVHSNYNDLLLDNDIGHLIENYKYDLVDIYEKHKDIYKRHN